MPSATEWNRHVDAAEFVLRNLAFENGTPRRGTPGDTNFVTVLNSSGADRVQGELLEFTGLATGLTDLAARHLMLNGGSPTLANGFGVLKSPIKSGDTAPDCQVAGNCIGQVNVTDATHNWAVVAAGTYVLQSAFIGPAQILWKPSGTGQKTCALRLGYLPQVIHRGITAATLNKGSNANVTRYKPGTTTSAGITDSVKNEFANIASGKVIYYFRDVDGTYYVLAGECPLT
jgi:hypothetical protein